MTTGGAAAVRGAHRHPLAALVVANLVYAGAFPASEVALRELGPMTLAGFRFLVAALLLAPVAAARAAADHARRRRSACCPSPRSGCGCRWC